jgi:hypothetical protein
MHRMQAGEPDAEGWMLAVSTEGGFSVRLPLKFNDFTLESEPNDATARIFVVGGKSQEAIRFSATRLTYRKGAEAAGQYFANFEKGQGLDTKPERITPQRVGDRPAVDIVLKRPADVSYQRVVRLQADLLLMVVEAPRDHDATVQPLIGPFFDSLVVSAK